MPVNDTVFCKDAPIIEIRDRIAVIRYPNCTACDRAMSIRNLTRAVERAQRALRVHAAGGENVIVED